MKRKAYWKLLLNDGNQYETGVFHACNYFYSFLWLGSFKRGGGYKPCRYCLAAPIWLAGALLSKTIFWGGLFGVIPAANFIYMGTQETGQIVDETPIGIVIFVFYLLCCIFLLYKKKKAQK